MYNPRQKESGGGRELNANRIFMDSWRIYRLTSSILSSSLPSVLCFFFLFFPPGERGADLEVLLARHYKHVIEAISSMRLWIKGLKSRKSNKGVICLSVLFALMLSVIMPTILPLCVFTSRPLIVNHPKHMSTSRLSNSLGVLYFVLCWACCVSWTLS